MRDKISDQADFLEGKKAVAATERSKRKHAGGFGGS